MASLSIVKVHYSEKLDAPKQTNEIAELSNGKFYLYTHDEISHQVTFGRSYANGYSAGGIEYVGKIFNSLRDAMAYVNRPAAKW